MPRDGSGIYDFPPGTPGVPGAIIESAKYNTYISDVKNDLNAARPIVVGGTGATDASTALLNLQGEKAKQVVTNFDSATFQSGSFYSDTTATAAPIASHRFLGVAVVWDASNIVLHAIDLDSATKPDNPWSRVKSSGTWSAWKQVTAPATDPGSGFVAKTGDTMTGALVFNSVVAVGAGAVNRIGGQKNGVARWDLMLGEGTAEPGSPANSGSKFAVRMMNNAGAQITFNSNPMLAINRDAPQRVTVENLQVGSGSSIQTMSSYQPAIWADRMFIGQSGRIGIGASYDASSGNYRQIGDGIGSAFISLSSDVPGGSVAITFSSDTPGNGGFINSSTYTNTMYIGEANFQVTAPDALKPGGGSWGDTSDGRVKQNIADYTGGLGEVMKLRPRVFSFREETGRDHQRRYVGLVAQEVEKILPEMVHQRDSKLGELRHKDMRVMDTTALTYALVNAVKTLNARIDAMEERAR